MGTLSLIIDFLSTVFLVRIQVVSVCDCGLDIYYMSNVFSSLNTPLSPKKNDKEGRTQLLTGNRHRSVFFAH